MADKSRGEAEIRSGRGGETAIRETSQEEKEDKKATSSDGTKEDLVPVRRTRQSPPDLHEIWDHQLEDLVNTNRDGLSDRMWFLFGVAAALIPTCAETLWDYYFGKTPISVLHLVEIMLFTLALGSGATIRLISGKRSNRAEEIAKTVRGQPRDSQIS